MTYSFPLTNFFTIFRQPTGLAIIASVGIHGIVGVGLEQVPILSKQKEISPVQLVELTPEQLSFLPEFSQPEIAAMNFDTLVPPSPGDAGSGLPAVPPAMEPLKPWTLPEGSSLYNSNKPLATIPSLENSPPAPSKNNSPTQTPKTPEKLPSRSPWEELLSQLPPPPPFTPSNNQYNESNQSPQQQLYTVPTAPASPPELPLPGQVETFNPNFPPIPPTQEFNPNFPPTQFLSPTPENNPPKPEYQPSPSENPDQPAINSPLPGGLVPGQQIVSSQALLDTDPQLNPNLVIPPGQQTTPTPETDPQQTDQTSPDETELLPGLDPDAWAYQQQLRQELLARQAAANKSPSNPQTQEPSPQPQQQAFSSPNPGQSNQQPPTKTPNNTESEPELVSGLKPEVWAYQQALRQEFLARQAAANQGETQTQEKVTRQQPAQATPQQSTTAPDSQSVSEVTETPEKKPEVVETPSQEQLTHHQQQILAYQQQLREEKRNQGQEGSLSEEEEAMLAGGEEFYTWFMQLRQELPNLTPKTPSSIAGNYPLAACPEKLSGRAVVGTVVNQNGEMIESPKVLSGTGSEILDHAALNYVKSVGFPANEQPTAYQYSFEFNYNSESCSIAAPEGSSENQTGNPEGETAIGETEASGSGLEGETSRPEIEAMETSPLNLPPVTPVEGTDESPTDALQPAVQSSETGAQTSPEATQDGQQQPSNPLTLEPQQPENSNGSKIFTPVPLPTREDL